MTSRSHTRCRRCGRNAHGGNDDHLCGRCWRADRAAAREQRLLARIGQVSRKVVAEQEISMAVDQVLGDRPVVDDPVSALVIQGVAAAIEQGELSKEDLEQRDLYRRAHAYLPEIHRLATEDEEEEIVAVPDDTQPSNNGAVDIEQLALGYLQKRDDNIIDLYANTPIPTTELSKAFGINVKVLYEILVANGVPKRSDVPGYKLPRPAQRGSLVKRDDRVEWVPPPAEQVEPGLPDRIAALDTEQARLEARLAELQAQLEAAQAAAVQAAQPRMQWRVSWQVVRSGEEVVEARTMVEAIELVRQQVGGDVEITGAVRE